MKIAAVLLTLIGLGQIIGLALGLSQVQNIFRFTAASPYPLVFNSVRGFEYWAHDLEITLDNVDGSVTHYTVDPAFFKKIKGPHLVKMAYALSFSSAPIIPRSFYLNPLSFLICHPRSPISWIRKGKEVRSFQIVITNKNPKHPFHWKDTINCDR